MRSDSDTDHNSIKPPVSVYTTVIMTKNLTNHVMELKERFNFIGNYLSLNKFISDFDEKHSLTINKFNNYESNPKF